jgi:hypothetical protein
MNAKLKARIETEPLYNLKFKPLEAFIVLQLINTSSLSGNDVENVYNLKQKIQKVLDKHKEKTGEFIGYASGSETQAVATNGV